jgi:hypothetical protein
MLYNDFILKYPYVHPKTKKRSFKIFRSYGIIKSKIIKVKSLELSLDIEFGYYTYEKLRKLFCLLVTNDFYVIPNEGVALLEYKRILSQGLATQVAEMNKKILFQPQTLIDKFEGIEDKNLLSDHPMFIAVYNTILKS